MLGWSGKFPDDPKCPKFGTSIVSTAYGAYLDHADAQNLAKPPFMRICREFENWRDLRALSGKFLWQKSCYPESFRFLRLCCSPCLSYKNVTKMRATLENECYRFFVKIHPTSHLSFYCWLMFKRKNLPFCGCFKSTNGKTDPNYQVCDEEPQCMNIIIVFSMFSFGNDDDRQPCLTQPT